MQSSSTAGSPCVGVDADKFASAQTHPVFLSTVVFSNNDDEIHP
jgi:hypothetical protein